jgi:acyl carrier protein
MDARALVSKIVEHPSVPVDLAAPLHDVKDWDSLSTMWLVLELEERLGRELTDDEVAGLSTLQDVQRLLDSA